MAQNPISHQAIRQKKLKTGKVDGTDARVKAAESYVQ